MKSMVLSNGEKEMTLEAFLKKLNEKVQANYVESFGSEHSDLIPVITAQVGRKNVKIITENRYGTSRSVYCFLDFAGNIYKAASWKAPAKHIRGSIFDPDISWGKSLGPYGAAYMK